MTDIPLLFILGVPRSGTTLVLNALKKGQDHIGGTTRESHFYNRYKIGQKDQSIVEDQYFKNLLPVDELLEISARSNDNLAFFIGFVQKYLAKTHKAFFVEKTPQHVFYYREIVRDFPGAKFIIVRRNVFANIQSLSFSKGRGSMLLVDRFGLFTKNSFFRYLLGMGKYYMYDLYLKRAEQHPNTVLQISFEELVVQPDKVKSDVEEALGVPLNSFQPTNKPASTNLEIEASSKFYTQAVDNYKQAMPESIQSIIEKTFVSKQLNTVKILMYTFYLYPFFLAKQVLYFSRGKRS